MAIRVLPTHLVNKIAAGEVIERPASIVKELVENALDAGAGRIDVTIEDGGRKRISVADDGCGMGPEDLALAFQPHATSKLSDEAELFRIATMGFRGEALASVASVSHAHIRTCLRTDPQGGAAGGHEVEASGSRVGEVRPCSGAAGTTVTVRDLFFNTPARRKFLRTANTEAGHVAEQITRLALPHPKVAFTLTHNGRAVHSLAACEGPQARVSDLLGADLAETLLPIVPRGTEPVKVSGLIGPPAAARGSGKSQYLFLNGRYIRDRLLAHAVREAYRGRIEPISRRRFCGRVAATAAGTMAAGALRGRSRADAAETTKPTKYVDVHVHPTQSEVRFRDSQIVHGEVLAALRETLNRANLAPTASLTAPLEAAQRGDAEPGGDPEGRRASLREALADFFKSAPPPQPRLSFAEDTPLRRSGSPGQPRRAEAAPATLPPRADAPRAHALGAYQPARATPAPAERPAESALPGGVSELGAIQVHNAYIVAPTEDGLIIVDQHALHERLIYNDLRRRLAESALTGQKLLIPETLSVTPVEADRLHTHAELLGRLGIEAVPFGPNTVAVQRFPSLLVRRQVAVGAFLREVLDALAEGGSADPEQLLEDILAMLACKAAVKAGDALTPAEIDSLLSRRDGAEKASACPHGRPTTLKLSLRDLERQFKRT